MPVRRHIFGQRIEPHDAENRTVVADVDVVARIKVVVPRLARIFDAVFFRTESGDFSDRV